MCDRPALIEMISEISLTFSLELSLCPQMEGSLTVSVNIP